MRCWKMWLGTVSGWACRAGAVALIGLSGAPSTARAASDDTDEAPGLTAPPPGAPVAIAPIGAAPPQLLEAARSVAHLPLPQRMARISDTMLGRPYLADPLGEGDGVDPDPLARYDVFDCLTFVEEVLALSMAGDPAHAGAVRLGLRYGGKAPTYANRHHFMELQWIPAAIANGWVVDTTAEYGPTTTLEREVTADTWARWRARARFALTDDQLPTGTMSLTILSLDDALEAVDRIRPGTIVLTVREDRPYKPIWISHVGFVVPADKPTVRHATRMSSKQVRDHGLAWYLNHLKTYSRWKAAGVALLEPVEQGPRISALPPGESGM